MKTLAIVFAIITAAPAMADTVVVRDLGGGTTHTTSGGKTTVCMNLGGGVFHCY